MRDGRYARLETVDRRSGRPWAATVGFVEPSPGTWLVAATSADAGWALNLRASPGAMLTVGDRTEAVAARELDGREHAAAVAALILRYGTPAEGLGHGPAFELRSRA